MTASGNLRGSFVVSMSYARTTGSARCNRSSMHVRVVTPCFASTVYHFPMRISKIVRVNAYTSKGSHTFINCNPNMIRNVELPNIHNEITRISNRSISYIINTFIIKEVESRVSTSRHVSASSTCSNPSTSPRNLRICIHRILTILILLRNGHNNLPHSQQIIHIRERQLQQRPPIPEQMIRHLQVFLLNSLHALHHSLKHPPAPLFDLGFPAPLHRNEEIWIVLDRSLEAATVVLEKVEVHARPASGNLVVFDGRTVHVDKPADFLLS